MDKTRRSAHTAINKELESRIKAAQKATPIVNRSEFLRVLLHEALIARGH